MDRIGRFRAFRAVPLANRDGSDTRIGTPETNDGGRGKERKREKGGKEKRGRHRQRLAVACRDYRRAVEAFETPRPPLGPLIERDRERGEGGYRWVGKVAKRAPDGCWGATVAAGRRKRLSWSRCCGTGAIVPIHLDFLKKSCETWSIVPFSCLWSHGRCVRHPTASRRPSGGLYSAFPSLYLFPPSLSLSLCFSLVDDVESWWPLWPSESPYSPPVATAGVFAVSTSFPPLLSLSSSLSLSLFSFSPVYFFIFVSVCADPVWSGPY